MFELNKAAANFCSNYCEFETESVSMHVLNGINLQLYFNCSSHNNKSKAENRIKNIILRHVIMPMRFYLCDVDLIS